MSDKIVDSRGATDILLSVEEKIITMIRLLSDSNLNNKLILSKLNILLSQQLPSEDKIIKDRINIESTDTRIHISNEPIKPRKQFNMSPPADLMPAIPKEKISNMFSKIPVGQRVTDNKGKDLFMADVIITNLMNNEVLTDLKTNAVGKWQAYLGAGKYSVKISKVLDAEKLTKIESMQEIEITPQMKSLQLPAIIINR